MERKIVIAITGASGSIYAARLLQKLSKLNDGQYEINTVFSNNALINWKVEFDNESFKDLKFKNYVYDDFYAPFASGSAQFDTMIIVPCSMGTIARIAHGFSENLITRAADVMLKERRKLILVPRETPYSVIHLQNMLEITKAGGIVLPASVSYYHKPSTIYQLVDTVVDRIMDIAQLPNRTLRWSE